ncbi:MAG: sugar transferase [Dehalococcoidia bacterium]
MAAPPVARPGTGSPAVEVRPLGPTLESTIAPFVKETPPWKRAMDVVGAAAGLTVLFPVLVLIGLAVMLDSRGGPLFGQTRVGKGGRTFTCWKFRSMVRDAESLQAALLDQNEAHGHIFKMKDDPRRTRVGRFLRKTSLDELPQLWNVLLGEMSLVGPRPPLPSEVARYERHQLFRLTVAPGITGLWQVTLRGQHDFADMVALDVAYARKLRLRDDLRILWRTVGTVLRGSGSC